MTAAHWDEIYASRRVDEVSWYQREPTTSFRLVQASAPDRSAAIVDVGSDGASSLVERMLDDGFRDVTLLDVSTAALEAVRTRLGDRADNVTFVCGDVLDWVPDRAFDVWHDRAVFHFLTHPDDRARYVFRAASAVRKHGALIVATFAADGPTHCSGLPVHRNTIDDLAGTFSGAFVPEWSQREDHITPAGVVQPFSWVVLRRA